MNTAVSSLRLTILVAACIVAAGLVASASIVAHRSVGGTPRTASVTTGPAVIVPPIPQQGAKDQFRSQVLASPKIHTIRYSQTDYTLTDVSVTQVIYSAKDDTFSIMYDLAWQPAMPPDSGLQSGGCSLNNDGYGHYYGMVITHPGQNDAKYADINIQ